MIRWMDMDFVLRISESSSLAVTVGSLGTINVCEMLLDLLVPVMA